MEETTKKTRAKKPKVDVDAIDVNVPRTREQNRYALVRKVKFFYDLQRLRLQAGGRVGGQSAKGKIQLHEVDLRILKGRAAELEAAEKHALSDVAAHLATIPFYTSVIVPKKAYFRGLGPTLWGVILSAFDPYRQDTVSKMWAYAGLRPMPAFRCKLCHSVVEGSPADGFKHRAEKPRKPPAPGEVSKPELPKCTKVKNVLTVAEAYESGQAQHPVKGERLAYNAWLRSKLCGVAVPVILQACEYRCTNCGGKLVKKKPEPNATAEEKAAVVLLHADPGDVAAAAHLCVYREQELASPGEHVERVDSPLRRFYDQQMKRRRENQWGRSDAHRHADAGRFMVKMILLEIYKLWRPFEGLPIRPSYHEEKQGGGAHPFGWKTPFEEKPIAAPVVGGGGTAIDDTRSDLDSVQDEIDAELANLDE